MAASSALPIWIPFAWLLCSMGRAWPA